ncbi:zeta toxin family protein [Streptomyces sp. NPDC002787]
MTEEEELLYLNREREIAAYEQGWWDEDARTQRMCDIIPDLRAELLAIAAQSPPVETKHVYKRDGTWHSDRLGEQASASTFIPAPKDRKTPRSVFILSGIPGAGKTSRLIPLAVRYKDTYGTSGEDLVVLCADEVRVRLPEYAEGLGSMVVHQEACDITYESDHPRAMNGTADVVIDGIGRPVHMSDYVKDWSASGWTVHILVARCTASVAIQRMKQRAIETGRSVPEGVIESAAADIAEVERALQGGTWGVSSWIIVDTSSDGALTTVDRTNDWAFE